MTKLPEPTRSGPRSRMSSRHRLRALDSVLVVDALAWASRPPVLGSADADMALLWLAGRGSLEWMRDGDCATCPPGSGLLLDLAGGADKVTSAEDGIVLVLWQPPVRLAAIGRAHANVLPPSVALRALRNLAGAWLDSDMRLDSGQARLAGRALGQLVAAALLPVSARGARERRKTSLLDGVIEYIDGRCAEALDTPALCKALSCSRSALYRATRPMGGVVALLKDRRLAAVYDRLCDPHEHASVGALASGNGFDDIAQFSRSFRQRYGRTATAVRKENGHPVVAGGGKC